MKNKKTEISSYSKNRNYDIVKHNDLIQKARYDLSMQEQKIILYLISKIKPNDEDFKEYEFKIKEFCEVCGIEERSGGNYLMLKDTILNLINKSFWVSVNGTYTSMSWIEKARINSSRGTIDIRLDKDMKPYLLQLREKFTSYSIYFTLAMKSKYSIRIYELLKSYQNLGMCEFDIERLKQLLACENYDIFANFKAKVLDIAVREINAYGDISVSYELEKQGRKFNEIKFIITPKYLDGTESWETIKRIEKILTK